MGKDTGIFYKHSQYQLSTLSINDNILLSLASQKSSYIELPTSCVLSISDKDQNDSILCSQNTIQNDLNITNIENIQSCETPRKKL